ncbi:DUF262 domain-containing protein [Flavobacterium lindanitolerans]|uniref:Uncharacterized protein DUF262 n=1 Tax=Flavobacterium lindanitolerans TaxID=428988 RepID=A0A497UB76_9FLAO|nr:DUF262 domain-containing protein [Flavobacterium lindanitolerans]PKW20237.1 uncharacterized protein DUF262 [Flavobacterium lindanitolerans]RLJ23804.1 uncharacterized protein DUF262 [Flavobacterium lindanitolerans]
MQEEELELSNIEQVDSSEQDYENDDLFNITSWGADMSFRELINMYDDDELLKPELQRKYVWEKVEASRFIESILLGLPIPSIFLANTPENNKLIIDGYQRIMTVYDYVKKGIFSKDGKTFKLTNNEKINYRWRGKSFNELDEFDQKKIRQTTIHAIIFEQKHPKDSDSSLFQIFERINTSGKILKPQEIRNCVYQGKLNSLLFELNTNETWRNLFGSDIEDSRMNDLEFILRFFALSDEDIKSKSEGQISLKLFLNNFMGKKSNNSKVFVETKRHEFETTMSFIYSHIGSNAFRNLNAENNYQTRFHPTIFDSISIATNYAINIKKSKVNVEILKQQHKKLLLHPDFKIYTSTRTTNIEHINGRINLACQILFGINYE